MEIFKLLKSIQIKFISFFFEVIWLWLHSIILIHFEIVQRKQRVNYTKNLIHALLISIVWVLFGPEVKYLYKVRPGLIQIKKVNFRVSSLNILINSLFKINIFLISEYSGRINNMNLSSLLNSFSFYLFHVLKWIYHFQAFIYIVFFCSWLYLLISGPQVFLK